MNINERIESNKAYTRNTLISKLIGAIALGLILASLMGTNAHAAENADDQRIETLSNELRELRDKRRKEKRVERETVKQWREELKHKIEELKKAGK